MTGRTGPYKLAVLASHPIQYQAPLFRTLANHPEIDLHVFFCCQWGLKPYDDPGFGVRFSWNVPLLSGYRHSFLANLGSHGSPDRFWGLLNPGIISTIARGGFNAVWIHGWGLATNWLAWAGAAALHVPILLRGETSGLHEPGGMKGAAKRIALRALFSRVAGFLAIGTRNRNFYRSYGIPDGRIFLMPYAVDNAYFMGCIRELESQKRALREKEGLNPNLPVILFCGKFQEKKNPLDLLKAFASLRGRLAASLAFVGDGPIRPELARFVFERKIADVYFLGFRNQQELPACYVMADVLVLPSSFEPWGLVLNEAMCCGLPVIASDQVGAAADLVRDGVNGFTYPAGNVDALADRLLRVLAEEASRIEMGKHSQEIISRWGFEQDAEGLLHALTTVTDRLT